MPSTWRTWVMMSGFGAVALLAAPTHAAQPLPWQQAPEVYAQNDAYNPDSDYGDRRDDRDDSYRPGPADHDRDAEPYDDRNGTGYGAPYAPPREGAAYDDEGQGDESRFGPRRDTYEKNEILNAGHRFFGSISQGLARVVEYAFKREGRPNGYILGDDAGGAFVAGLRYGEGVLYTKYDGDHKVYWQGPSIGYDFGGEGSKTMVLVYNLREPSDIYHRFPGVEGSAYLVGGVGIEFKKYGDIVIAPIRAGVGLRLGANVGYLKYTRSPTLNPF